MHRRNALVSAVIVAVIALAGCAGNEDTAGEPSPSDPTGSDPTGTTSATTEPADEGQVIEITIEGDSVRPNGTKVDVEANEPVILDITADAPGEIHIHSTPEQEIEYDAGKSQHSVTFNRPGVVEVESHTLEKVIVQLQVR